MKKQTVTAIDTPWAMDIDSVLETLGGHRPTGLDNKQVRTLTKKYGPNKLTEHKKESLWKILANQFKSLIVILLAVAAVLSFCFQEWADGFAILGVIIINAAIGFYMEVKAVRSMEALQSMERVTAKVRRGGQVQEINSIKLVPGDIVLLEGGDIVSADMRLLTAMKFQADESVLTGESLPVTKNTQATDDQAGIGDRVNMVFKGTAITRGSAEAVVTATGMATELGHISALVAGAEDEVTPLEKRLESLGRNLLWVTLALIVVIAATGIARGQEIVHMIETAIALAVAAIPEGLPIVATLALARGMLRMAKHNALVNQLAAVETLGGVSVICTDKTGTLTENKMTVTELIFLDKRVSVGPADTQGSAEFKTGHTPIDAIADPQITKLMEVAALCNNAALSHKHSDTADGVGDPLEIALLVAAQKVGIDHEQIMQEHPEDYEDAFDSDSKRMATFNRYDDQYRVSVKGAMETVLEGTTRVYTDGKVSVLDEPSKNYWLKTNLELAKQGYRVLAFAEKQADSIKEDPYQDLVFIGLTCMEDPAREDVKPAITACKNAGIQVVMITGDHPVTASSIAASIELTDDKTTNAIIGKDIKSQEQMSDHDRQLYRQTSVFARVSPKQKLDLIAVHQQAGAVVAMTGDGVNDAPALKKADIGVAMGLRGTQVAKEAADMVLKDDAFSTIVLAVEQGRIIYENIKKFVVYLLSCNISEIMVVFIASLAGWPMPILPLQILFLNLVTDVFPALALGVCKGNGGIMQAKPRPSDEPIMNLKSWAIVGGYGMLLTASVLGGFIIALKAIGWDEQKAVTISFLTLAFSQLWHVFNMRGKGTTLFNNEIMSNKFIWAALILCTLLLVGVVYFAPAATILDLANPGLKGWLLVAAASAVTFVIGQAWKVFHSNKR